MGNGTITLSVRVGNIYFFPSFFLFSFFFFFSFFFAIVCGREEKWASFREFGDTKGDIIHRCGNVELFFFFRGTKKGKVSRCVVERRKFEYFQQPILYISLLYLSLIYRSEIKSFAQI